MRAFMTIEDIRTASVEELAQAPSMNARSARAVYEFFHHETGGEEQPGVDKCRET